MNEFINTLRKQFTEWNAKTARTLKIRIAALALLALALIVTASIYFSRIEYGVLYSGMEPADAGATYDKLVEMGIPVDTRGADTILVPKDQISTLKMQLASQGYPPSGVSYDDSASLGIGATEADKRAAANLRTQSEIREALRTMSGVRDASVRIVPAEESLYALSGSSGKVASASIVLTLESGKTLTQAEADAIGRVVMTSVQKLELENIALSDTNMHLYELGGENSGKLASDQLVLQQEIQDKLTQQVNDLLYPIFGTRSNSMVTCKLNFDNKVTEETIYSTPIEGRNEGLALSLERLNETIRGDQGTQGAVGAEANTGVPAYPADGTNTGSQYEKTSEKINYELNTVKTIVEQAKGVIEDISVAIVIDSTTYEDDNSAIVASTVAMGLGIPEEKVLVNYMPMLPEENAVAAQIAAQQQYDQQQQLNDLIRMAIIAAAIVIVVIILLIMARTLINARKATLQAAAEAAGYGGSVVGPDGLVHYDPNGESYGESTPDIAETINSDRSKIEAFIEKDPESVARLLRNWLAD